MLDEYTMLRHEREEEKRRLRDHKKFHDQQTTDPEIITNSRPSPVRTIATKKAGGARANGAANGTPSSRRLSLNQNGSRSMNKDSKRDSMRPMTPVKYDAISKDDSGSHISGTEPVSASP